MHKALFNASFFVLFCAMLFVGARLLWPSAGALLGAAALAIVFYPVHKFLDRYIPNRTICAALSDLFVFTFFLVPVGFLVWVAIGQSENVILIAKPVVESVIQWAQSAPHGALAWISGRSPWLAEQLSSPSAELQSHFDAWTHRAIASIAQLGAGMARMTALLAGYVFLAIVALFFFFRDGETLLQQMNRLLPLRATLKLRLEEKIRRMLVGVVRGSILTSMVQGVAATIGFLILRTPSAFLLGLVTLLVSFIPFFGSALIWGPISFYYFWSGALWKGAFLLLWGALVTGSIDNFLRPWFVGAKEDVPFFWLFFSIVGGIQVYGLFGILIGPVVMAILVILLDIYQQAYLRSSD